MIGGKQSIRFRVQNNGYKILKEHRGRMNNLSQNFNKEIVRMKKKTNIQKLVAFLYTDNELSERETKKTI